MRLSLSIPLTAVMAIAASTAGAAEAANPSAQVAPATAAKPSTTPAPQKIMTAEAQPAAPVAFESMEANGQKYVLVCSIKTVEANRQF
jgi:hypothetical protein